MTGLFRGLDFATYCAWEMHNLSRLKLMAKSPAHYLANQQQDTPALSIGRLIHMAVLEPELFTEKVSVWTGGLTKDGRPTTNKLSQAYKDFAASVAASGGTVVSAQEYSTCSAIADAIEGSEAAPFFHGGEAEISIAWEHRTGIECKSRIDYLGPSAVVDLKTAADVSPRQFNRAILRYHYHAQAAFYVDAVKALTGQMLPFYIVAVEKVAPYDVAVYRFGEDVLELGRKTYEGWIDTLLRCKRDEEWPGSAPGINSVELPSYAWDDFDDETIYVDGIRMQGDPSAL